MAASVPDDQLPSCVDEAMTVQVPVNQCAGIIIYLLTITGTALLATKLSSVVAEQTIVLALPHLDNRLPKLSLSEHRVEAPLVPYLTNGRGCGLHIREQRLLISRPGIYSTEASEF